MQTAKPAPFPPKRQQFFAHGLDIVVGVDPDDGRVGVFIDTTGLGPVHHDKGNGEPLINVYVNDGPVYGEDAKATL